MHSTRRLIERLIKTFLSITKTLRHVKTNKQGHSRKSHRVMRMVLCPRASSIAHKHKSWKIPWGTDHLLRQPVGNPTKCACVSLFAYVCVITRTHLHTLDCNSHSGNSVYSSRTCQSATWPVCRRPSSGGATATRAAQENRTGSKASHAPEPTHTRSTKRTDCCGLKEYMCKNAGPRANARALALFRLLMLLSVPYCAHVRGLALEAAQECTRRRWTKFSQKVDASAAEVSV